MDNIALFKGINEGGLDELLGYLCAETKVCKKNVIIWKKGEKISDIALVLIGRVKFCGNNADGETVYGFAGDSQIFGADVICQGAKIAPFDFSNSFNAILIEFPTSSFSYNNPRKDKFFSAHALSCSAPAFSWLVLFGLARISFA